MDLPLRLRPKMIRCFHPSEPCTWRGSTYVPMVLGHAARQLFGDGNAGAAGVTPRTGICSQGHYDMYMRGHQGQRDGDDTRPTGYAVSRPRVRPRLGGRWRRGELHWDAAGTSTDVCALGMRTVRVRMRYIRGRTKARGDCTRTSLNIQHSQVFFSSLVFSRNFHHGVRRSQLLWSSMA